MAPAMISENLEIVEEIRQARRNDFGAIDALTMDLVQGMMLK